LTIVDLRERMDAQGTGPFVNERERD